MVHSFWIVINVISICLFKKKKKKLLTSDIHVQRHSMLSEAGIGREFLDFLGKMKN